MTVATFVPDEELKPLVESFLIVRSEGETIRTLPPNTAPTLVFRFQGITEELLAEGERVLPRMAITGLNHGPRLIRYHDRSTLVLVRFREGGTALLTAASMEELTGISLGLDSLIEPRQAREVQGRLDDAVDDEARIAVLQAFLKARLPDRALDPLVASTIERIRISRGKVGIKDLVRDLATNPDSLEKRFRHAVGAPPKLFSRIVRFQNFVKAYAPGTDLTEAALRAGYYDQAHLAKEFRMFTGQSPTTYLLNAQRW